ncbi:GntR family histidine utilization transcriptional repressor [Mesorhizobium soli]|uniref:histidine utilization repressor n=1 Tax=Pseudaminobacter soli (ex Li et al. 2025) TaxID=1295366 RepID=UPI002476FB5E|nr:histidine utilization repressor [Mesorhizobium soli]MDH6232242.1 GntR family histidine utilization transcriptional repressor [Mesorhizobium soli]
MNKSAGDGMSRRMEGAQKQAAVEGDGIGLGQQVRNHVLAKVSSGEWPEGYRIPSESRLAGQFSASRMTIHIALRDLSSEGVLVRRQGAGTFVAPRRSQSTFLELRNIHSEIEGRGNLHTTDVIKLEEVNSDLTIATEMNISPGSIVFHSILVHRENGKPLQIEDRYVNPRFSPDYLEQDFTKITPHAHLMATGPLEEIEHIIQAVPVDEVSRKLLEMQSGEPLLLLRRRTWSRGMIASSARLLHPGSRFSLAGRMKAAR